MLNEALHGTTDMAMNSQRSHGDETLLVKFFTHPKQNQLKSKEAGRPIFEDVPYIFLNYRNHRTARRTYVKNFKTGKLKGREDIRRVWIDK